jgi:hypothetical protein
VEIVRTPAGRLEGRIRTQVAEPVSETWRPYSGVLELLKVLEELLDAQSPVTNDLLPRETP